ncbi:MAG: hypothetical protein Q7S01_05865 [bacterium]|nr:hypothetical protein [bacterium]
MNTPHRRIKACLILQRRFAYVGHDIVKILRREHGIEEFCALVSTRTSLKFLLRQKDVSYSELLLDEDIQRRYRDEVIDWAYLQWLEREYGMPNLWPYINVDRVIRFGQLVREYPHDTPHYSHEDMLKMLQCYAKAIIVFLEKEKPTFLFSSPPGAMCTVLFHHIAKKMDVRIFIMGFPCIRNRALVSEWYDRFTFVESFVEKHQKQPTETIPHFEDARSFIREFRERPRVYSAVHEPARRKFTRRQHFSFLAPQKFAPMLGWILEMTREWWNNREARGDYSTIRPWNFIRDAMRRKTRNLIGFDDLYDDWNYSHPFAFYPLHLEPELNLLLMARFDIDQVVLIRRVAQSLPVGMKLVVKEHPQMVSFRPRRFYKEIKKIPNVMLIRPEISGFDVIARAALVTLVAGTAGWEAALFGKPVITFGNVFYNALPSVTRSSTPEELPALVREKLVNFTFDEDALVRFVAAIFEDSVKADMLNIWEFGGGAEREKQLSAFAGLIASKVRA